MVALLSCRLLLFLVVFVFLGLFLSGLSLVFSSSDQALFGLSQRCVVSGLFLLGL